MRTPVPPWPRGGLWRHADFLKLWSAQTISQLGTQISGIALPLVALFTVVRSDERGFASTHLSIPEFAGQLRIMAVAHAGPQYGAAEPKMSK